MILRGGLKLRKQLREDDRDLRGEDLKGIVYHVYDTKRVTWHTSQLTSFTILLP